MFRTLAAKILKLGNLYQYTNLFSLLKVLISRAVNVGFLFSFVQEYILKIIKTVYDTVLC